MRAAYQYWRSSDERSESFSIELNDYRRVRWQNDTNKLMATFWIMDSLGQLSQRCGWVDGDGLEALYRLGGEPAINQLVACRHLQTRYSRWRRRFLDVRDSGSFVLYEQNATGGNDLEPIMAAWEPILAENGITIHGGSYPAGDVHPQNPSLIDLMEQAGLR